MGYGKKKFITLKHFENDYKAYFHRESNEPHRTRLFWHSDFKEVININFSNYKKIEENKENYPIMRFKKSGIDSYNLNFIAPEFIENDIEFESELTNIVSEIFGNKEGKQISFYSEKMNETVRIEKMQLKFMVLNVYAVALILKKHMVKEVYDTLRFIIINHYITLMKS